jgi:hypothetical protein
MSFHHSPQIVNSGLVLCLDAADPKSYPGSGTSWFDRSGNGNHASLINGASYNSSGPKFIRCDGTNDYIEVLDSSSLDFGSSNFTVEYWFRKLRNTSSLSDIWGVNKWNTGASPGTNEWTLAIGNGSTGTGNNYSFAVQVGTTSYSSGASTELLSLGVWYQLIGVRNGGTLQAYLNSELKLTNSPSGFTSSSVVNNVSGRNLRINNSALNNYYTNADNGAVRIYNRALTQDEILQNYNASRTRFQT